MEIDITPEGLAKGNIFALKLRNNELINARNLIREGRPLEALVPMISAMIAEPNNPASYQNFSDFYEMTGAMENAISVAEASAALNPDEIGEKLFLAEKYMRNHQSEDAIECCKHAIELDHHSGSSWGMLGGIYWTLERPRESFECFRKMTKAPNVREKLFLSAAERFFGIIEPSEMRLFLEDAVAYFPKSKVMKGFYAQALVCDGRPSAALKLIKGIESFENDSLLVCAASRAYIDIGYPEGVLKLLAGECNTAGQEKNIDAFRAISLRLTGQLLPAKRAYEKLIESGVSDISVFTGYATCLACLGLDVACLDALNKALELAAKDTSALLLEKTECLSRLGRESEAQECFRRASFSWINPVTAFDGPSLPNAEFEENIDWRGVESIFDKGTLSRSERLNMMFALGHQRDAVANYQEAMSLWYHANQEIRAGYNFDVTEYNSWLMRIPHAFSNQSELTVNGQGDPPFRPIFIVGMPRTGTSLAEHILSAHSNVRAGGESQNVIRLIDEVMSCFPSETYPEFLKNFDDDDYLALRAKFFSYWKFANLTETFVVDKLPGNFVHIGLIQKICPEAIFIECVRDTRDTALSIFGHWFQEGHPYAYDMDEILSVQEAYRDVMLRWRDVIPNKIHTLNYENLVSSPLSEIKELLNYCNLPFEENCLEPHKTKRAIENSNARRLEFPIGSTRVGRAHNYNFAF